MTVELDRHKINEFSLKITSLLHWKTTAQLLPAVLSHEFHSRSPAGNRPLKKISHANSFFSVPSTCIVPERFQMKSKIVIAFSRKSTKDDFIF